MNEEDKRPRAQRIAYVITTREAAHDYCGTIDSDGTANTTMGELGKIMRDNQRLVERAQDAAVTSVMLSGAALAIALLTLIMLAITAGT